MKLKIRIAFFALFLLCIFGFSSIINSNIENKVSYRILTPPQDSYADEIVESISYFYFDGTNALGAPDEEYARIFAGYANGRLTLDMGRYESIINGSGDDFTIHCLSGVYTVRAGNDASTFLKNLGQGENTSSFDLETAGLTEARFIQVEYNDGGNVYLDAIEAINLEPPIIDSTEPEITPVEDFSVWDNTSKVEFTWLIDEAHPWNYTIKLNDVIYEQGEWINPNIDFNYDVTRPETLHIVLQVDDYFGNSAMDTVIVEIKGTGKTSSISVLMSFICLLGITFVYFRNKRK